MKIKTSTEHIGEDISMELDVKFSLYMEPNFTSRYLTSIINHPVIITAYDATNAKSATKGMYRIRRAAESKSIPP